MFFRDWEDIWRTLIVGSMAYVALIALLRISGKRTLSKMNSFDLVVTVTLGSTLASLLVSKDIPLAEGVTALALLITLQFVVAWSSVRWKWFSAMVKSQPALVLYRGAFLPAAMKAERIVEAEIRAAIRDQGVANIQEILAVVLETDGSFTVVKSSNQWC